MGRLTNLDGVVTGFTVEEAYIDCMCGRELLKLDKRSGDVIYRKAVFEKDGLSRKLTAHNGRLFIYDFCTFYMFSQNGYELLGKWQLGQDLSSDICGMAVDGDMVYCSIRNGNIITINGQSVKEFSVSDSSMWSVEVHDDHLLCGTVGGSLLKLDKATMSIEKELPLGKKNIASIYIHGDTLYAACQDGKLFRINTENFGIEALTKKAHRKMFRCAGMCGDMLVTVSYPCSQIALWDGETLEKQRVIDVPLSLSGCAHIEDGLMYITSRNIPGIDMIDLSE